MKWNQTEWNEMEWNGVEMEIEWNGIINGMEMGIKMEMEI